MIPTTTEASASAIVNKWFEYDSESTVCDKDVCDPKKKMPGDPATRDARYQLWAELNSIGIKTAAKLRDEIISKLNIPDGVVNMPMTQRHATRGRGVQHVKFVPDVAMDDSDPHSNNDNGCSYYDDE